MRNAESKLNKELSDEIEEEVNGKVKKKYVLNENKLRKYLISKIESIKEKDRSQIYLALAGNYTAQKKKK